MSADTPWGRAGAADAIADGIIRYMTASHGGIKISEERFEQMPEPYKSIRPFAGRLWYEEDADWALIALSFPNEYCADLSDHQRKVMLENAQRTFNTYHAPKLKQETEPEDYHRLHPYQREPTEED